MVQPISLLRPDLLHERAVGSSLEIFRNKVSGFLSVWCMENNDNTGPMIGHLGWVNPGNPPSYGEMLGDALAVEETHYARAQLHGPRKDLPTILDTDWHDSKHKTYATGGVRRSLVSNPLLHILARNATSEDRETAFLALRSWCSEQTRRPLSWWPWDFSCDNYSCYLDPARDNQKVVGPDGIERNAWDVQHLETTPHYALAALGDDLGLMSFWMLWRWAADTFPPPQSHWLTSWRGLGWVILMDVRAAYLGLLPDERSHTGFDAVEHLRARIDFLIRRSKELLDPAEDYSSKDQLLKLEEYDGEEVRGYKPYNAGITLYALKAAMNSPFLSSEQNAKLKAIGKVMGLWIWEKSKPSSGTAAVPFACGYTVFSWDEAQYIVKLAHDQGLEYEAHPVDGGFTIRPTEVNMGEDEILWAAGELAHEQGDVSLFREIADSFELKPMSGEHKEQIAQPLRRMLEDS